MDHIIKKDVEELLKLKCDWGKLHNSSILVTGATGFIGAYLVHTLMKCDQNISLVIVARTKEKARSLFSDYVDKPNFIILIQDIQEEINYEGNIDYIIHAASNAAPEQYTKDPVGTMKTNLIGTINILEFSKRKNIKKFLYLSTIEVYGNAGNPRDITEDDFGYIDSMYPRSCYPISKKTSETLCASYAEQYGIDYSIGRLSYIYGPGMDKNDSKVVAQFARKVARGEDLILKSKGENLRSYCYIADAISGLIYILLYGENNEAYNIASKINITSIYNMAVEFSKLYTDKKIKVKFELNSESHNVTAIKDAVLNTEKLEALGWQPTMDLQSGLKNMVESFKVNK